MQPKSVPARRERGRSNSGTFAVSHTREVQAHQQEISDILRWELRRLGSEAPALAPRADAFTQRFPASGS